MHHASQHGSKTPAAAHAASLYMQRRGVLYIQDTTPTVVFKRTSPNVFRRTPPNPARCRLASKHMRTSRQEALHMPTAAAYPDPAQVLTLIGSSTLLLQVLLYFKPQATRQQSPTDHTHCKARENGRCRCGQLSCAMILLVYDHMTNLSTKLG